MGQVLGKGGFVGSHPGFQQLGNPEGLQIVEIDSFRKSVGQVV